MLSVKLKNRLVINSQGYLKSKSIPSVMKPRGLSPDCWAGVKIQRRTRKTNLGPGARMSVSLLTRLPLKDYCRDFLRFVMVQSLLSGQEASGQVMFLTPKWCRKP